TSSTAPPSAPSSQQPVSARRCGWAGIPSDTMSVAPRRLPACWVPPFPPVATPLRAPDVREPARYSMSEPVLERSVLERKERDELLTIARALGAKPAARSKKADLVDLILTTAGIGASAGNGHEPGGATDAAPTGARPREAAPK